MIIDMERRWRTQAACAGVGTDLFFTDHAVTALEEPTKKVQAEWDKAKQVCAECPVIAECGRDYLGEVDGVWGGMDPAERYRVRRKLGEKLHTMTGPRKVEYAKLAWDLRKQGCSSADISRFIGVSVATCSYLEQWYQDYLDGKTPTPHVPKGHRFKQTVTESDIKQIIGYREAGLTLGEVATRVGYSEYTVRKYIGVHAPHLLERRAKRGAKEVRTLQDIGAISSG